MGNINENNPIPKVPESIMHFEPVKKRSRLRKTQQAVKRVIKIVATTPGDQRNLLNNSRFRRTR